MSKEKGKGKVETINLPPSSEGLVLSLVTAIRTEATGSPVYKAFVNEVSEWAKSHDHLMNASRHPAKASGIILLEKIHDAASNIEQEMKPYAIENEGLKCMFEDLFNTIETARVYLNSKGK